MGVIIRGITEYAFATAGTYFENTRLGRKSIAENLKWIGNE